MIIDFYLHPPHKMFLSEPIMRPRPAPKSRRQVSPWTVNDDPSPSKEQLSMDLFLSEMEEAGISQAVIKGINRGAQHGGHVSNDGVAEIAKQYPGRFHLFGAVSYNDVPAAVAEIQRVMSMGFKGIAVYPGWNDPPVYLDDQRFYPIYETCQELGAILQVTSSVYLGPDLDYVAPIRMQHIAADFPDLLIVVPYGGWPYVLETLGIALRYTNVWLVSGLYMNVPGIPGAGHYVEAANYYLADRILFGSSYPSRSLKRSVEDFKSLPLRPDVLEKALFKNAQWILGEREPW